MSHVIYERVMTHIGMSLSHIWMRHATHMTESCHTYDWVMSYIWMSHVTHSNETCHTYLWVMSHSPHIYMDASCDTYEWDTCTHVFSGTNECPHTYEWVVYTYMFRHKWMSTYEWDTCHTHDTSIWMSHVTLIHLREFICAHSFARIHLCSFICAHSFVLIHLWMSTMSHVTTHMSHVTTQWVMSRHIWMRYMYTYMFRHKWMSTHFWMSHDAPIYITHTTGPRRTHTLAHTLSHTHIHTHTHTHTLTHTHIMEYGKQIYMKESCHTHIYE